MNDASPQAKRALRPPWLARPLLLFGAAVAAAALLLRAQTTEAPIMASDEYAYDVLGRFPQTDLFRLDPGLPHVDNKVTFALLHTWSLLDGGTGVRVTRLVHVIEWLIVAGVLFLAFRGVVADRARGVGALATLMLPSVFYALTTMPETDLVFLAALLGWTVIAVVPRRPLVGAALGGVISGIAILVKPHAIAWIPAVLATLVAAALLERTDRSRRGPLLISTGLFILGWVAGLVLAWRLSSGSWSIDLGGALGVKYYGSMAVKADGSGFSIGHLLRAAGYVAGHLVVLGLIFGPALFSMVDAVVQAHLERHCSPAGYASVFVLAMLLFHIAMVSQFSASVGAMNAGEAMRLHGRYLGVALIFLPFFYVGFVEAAAPRLARWAALAGVAFVALFGWAVVSRFKIYPWDYPELFAFYAAPNHYGWPYSPKGLLGRALLACCLIAFVSVVAWPRLRRPVLTAQFLVVLAVGNVQVQRWLTAHMTINDGTIQTGEAMRRVLAPSAPGDGLVVGAERYGQMSYLLFALGNAPRVLVREGGADITENDVAGAKWVVASRSYTPRFAFRTSIQMGELVLFPIATTSLTVSTREREAWKDEPFSVDLAADKRPPAILSGFNPQEGWGAWTSRDVAEVELSKIVSGKLRLRIFGWVLPERAGAPVQFTIGESTRSVRMGGVNAEYQLQFDIHDPADRLRIVFPTTRPAGSGRDMGVAIQRLEFDRS